MFSRPTSGMLLLAGLLLVTLAGCQRGAEQFTKLDADKSGFLTAEEIDANQDGTILPDELDYKNTYTRRVEKFFADGGSADDKQLSPAEFDQALLGNRMPGWMIAVIVVLVIGIPLPLGLQLGNYLRMPDHGWKISLILLTITAAAAITYFGWPPKRGIDLSGGVILIYEIDVAATRQQGVADDAANGGDSRASDDDIKINDVVAALRRRINPGGVKEIVVRPYGSQQVEIIVPEVEATEVDYIKDVVSRTGQLEFLIVAHRDDSRHKELIVKALSRELLPLRETNVARAGEYKGRWVPVGVEERQRDEEPDYHGIGLGDVLRAKQKGSDRFTEVIIPESMMREVADEKRNLKQVLDELQYDDLQVLMLVDIVDRYNIKGQHLRKASSWIDTATLDPAVLFEMKPTGAALLERLTSDNLPDKSKDLYRRLGIIMDGELISAPRLLSTIGREGQITGNFTQKEVDFLVNILRAGRLPAVLRKEPISENQVSALLGVDTIRQGAIAIISSLVITLVFMLYYYRFAGLVACMALLLNLLFTIALMISIRAAFTLPGIAGLVLGVGMSVDANILIFERIREEMERGAGLRMALRNGFSRAATTIIDSNVTTLITAVVLYAIGTEQIRGFAVTLILGLLISMFTAIFCARVVFDIAERQRWITRLKMTQWIKRTNFDFISKQRWAIAGSLLIMVIGLGAVLARGNGILDIDFNGGTSVELLFKEPQPIEQVRAAVEARKEVLGETSVTAVSVEGYEDGRVYKIDSGITGNEPPVAGDPATYDPAGGDDPSAFTVAAVNAEKESADLLGADGKTKLVNIPWDDFQRDGVRIVQDELIKIFAGKLEQRSLTIESVAALDEGEAESTPADDDGGETEPSDDDLQPDPSPDDPPSTDPPATTETPDPETPATDEPATDEPENDTPPVDEPDSSDPASDDSDAAPESDPSSATPDAEDGSAIFEQPFVFTALQDEAEPAASEEEPTDSETTEPPAETATPETTDETTEEPTTESPPDEGTAEETSSDTTSEPGTVDETTTDEPDVVVVRDGRTAAQLKFGHPVNAPTVTAAVKKATADTLGVENLPGIRLSNKDWDGSPGQRFTDWTVDLPLEKRTAERVLDAMQNDLEGQPVWLSSSKIGPQIAGNLREKALASLIFATLGIIGYIWFRFHRAVFGVAAVIAMVHDVLITLGAIGLSLYLSKFLGFLGIDEFKINMTVIAAILTVIGFSLNDTVVVFDRIREVRGKNPDLTVAMVNQSVNQTLSRTLLTSFTTILSLLVMYAIGGPSIRAFAFTLLVGIVVGTFSSIYIASPCLLWLMKVTKQVPNRPEKAAKTPDLTNV